MGDSSDWWVCSLANDWFTLAVVSWASLTTEQQAFPPIFPILLKSRLMFRYRVVFGLPTKQVKNKLPLLRTHVRRYRSENHPTSEDSGLHSIQDPKQNEKKKKLYSFGNIYTLSLPVKPWWLERNSVSSLWLCSTVGSSHPWEPDSVSFGSDRLSTARGQHSAVRTARCTQTQVLPPHSCLQTDTGVKHFSNTQIV